MMNDTWWHTDRQIFERVPSCDLLQTVEGLPVWKSFNTAGFGIVTAEVKEKLQNILIGIHGDLLIDTLEREFDRWHVLGILHAFYLWLYHETIRTADISKSITAERSMYGRLLERIFAHNLSLCSDRFTAFKTPRKIDEWGANGPWLDAVFWDTESDIIWWVLMTADTSKKSWIRKAQREIDQWIFSNLWYSQCGKAVLERYPPMYTPNRIMSIRFHNMNYDPRKWGACFKKWKNEEYAGHLYEKWQWEEWLFLKEFFIDFQVIMDKINSIIGDNPLTIQNVPFKKQLIWEMQIECEKNWEWVMIKYSRIKKNSNKPISITIQIVHKNFWIPNNQTGNIFIDSLAADMYHAWWGTMQTEPCIRG